MKRFSLAILASLFCFMAVAQEMSVEEAMAKMKETSRAYLTSAFTQEDETGVDQFVDVEITGVHDFSDFSYGALLSAFKEYLTSRIPTTTLSSGKVVESLYPRTERIKIENARMIEYAEGNMKNIAAYAAIVDYSGITKFHEKKDLSRLFFFNSKGEVIGLKLASFARNEYKQNLAPCMFKKVIAELSELGDPLFPRWYYWVSEMAYGEKGSKKYEMQWCYALTKDNPGDSSIDKGRFCAYYYQTQIGFLQTIKSITVVSGTYEKDQAHFRLYYNDIDVESFHVPADKIASYSPGDYKSIDLNNLNSQAAEAARFKKALRDMDGNPNSYTFIDDKSFQMLPPFLVEPVTFNLQND